MRRRCLLPLPMAVPRISGPTYANTDAQVQTPTQRRANAKFAKEQESRMGKSADQVKKRSKDTPKSPISPLWIG